MRKHGVGFSTSKYDIVHAVHGQWNHKELKILLPANLKCTVDFKREKPAVNSNGTFCPPRWQLKTAGNNRKLSEESWILLRRCPPVNQTSLIRSVMN